MQKLYLILIVTIMPLLTGCFTSTKLSYGDLKFSRLDMGWQSVQIPNATFTATNGTQIKIEGYSKDSKDTVDGVKQMVISITDLTKILAPAVLAQEAVLRQSNIKD